MSQDTSPVTAGAEPAAECCAGSEAVLLDRESAAELATVFKALADPTRVRLLRYLADSAAGTACACHLPEALGVSQPTLSFHTSKLYDAGLVTRERRGRWMHYAVRPEVLEQLRGFLAGVEHADEPCC